MQFINIQTPANGHNVTNAKCDEWNGQHYGQCQEQTQSRSIPEIHENIHDLEIKNVGCELDDPGYYGC